MGWTVHRDGIEFDIVTGQQRREAMLLADGTEVDRHTAEYWDKARLSSGDRSFEVRWGARNTITSVHVLEGSEDDPHRVPLVPPPGSKAAKQEAFAREHPGLFVLRRVGQAGLEIVLGVLGVGVLLSAVFGQLLPRIDLPRVPRPDLSDVEAPDWLRYVDPLYWLGRLGLSWPDVTLPGWLDAVLGASTYWLPLVVAVFIALGELDRRRKRDAERHDDDRGDSD